jgi:hypothetical protein
MRGLVAAVAAVCGARGSGAVPIRTRFGDTAGAACHVKADARDSDIGDTLSWLCGTGEVDCAQINPGGAHYEPNTNKDHANWAFDQYYQKHASSGPASCFFGGLAALVPPPFGHFDIVQGGTMAYPTQAKQGIDLTEEIPKGQSKSYTSPKMTGNYTGDGTAFSVWVAASGSGVEAHAEVGYDFDGDGTPDRTEVHRVCPRRPDPPPTSLAPLLARLPVPYIATLLRRRG